MSERDGYDGTDVVLAFLAGAVTGACVALLSTPQSGSDTRDKLSGWAQEARGRAPRLPRAVRSAWSDAAAAAKQAFVDAWEEPGEPTDSTTGS